MSKRESGLTKCRTTKKEEDGSDLSLSGSQVSLISRPRSVMGKASARALSVSTARHHRPMSALPMFSCMEGTHIKRRPYSADSQPLFHASRRRSDKVPARFALTPESMTDTFHQSLHDLELDGDLELSTSTLLDSHLSDQFGSPWMELEMQDFCLDHPQLGLGACPTDHASDLPCRSDISEEPTRSEKSLGECIKAMARNTSQAVVSTNASCMIDRLYPSPNLFPAEKDAMQKPQEKSDPLTGLKHLSAKELHSRMFESGLVPDSTNTDCHHSFNQMLSYERTMTSIPSHNSAERKFTECGNSYVEESCSVGIFRKPSASELTKKRSDSQLCNVDGGMSDYCTDLKEENSSNSVVGKEIYSLDQECFPEDHDVVSLGEEASCSNSNLEGQNSQANVSVSNYFPSKTDITNAWERSTLGPVRFQQWVNGGSSTERFPEYFRGSRSSLPQYFSDCNVEEVSGDCDLYQSYCNSERSKTTGKEHSFESNPSKQGLTGNFSFERMTVASEKSEKAITVEISKENDRPEEIEVEPKSTQNPFISEFERRNDEAMYEMKTSSRGNANKEDGFSPYSVSNSNQSLSSVETFISSHSQNSGCEKNLSESGKYTKHNVKQIDCNMRKKENFPLRPNSIRNGQSALKRITDRKSSGVCGRNTRNNQPLKKPEEETFTAESQPELLSWMSLCSAPTREGGSSSEQRDQGSAPVNSPQVSGSDDSHYNEILTILRVLEEEEDESSLMKILSKRSSTPADSFTVSTASAGVSSQAVCSSSQHVPENFNTDASSSQPNPELTSSEVIGESKTEAKNETIINQALSPPEKTIPVRSGVTTHSNAPAQGELRDLLTFLDAVDQSCSNILHTSPALHTDHVSTGQPKLPNNSNGIENLLLLSQSDLAQEVLSLRLSLEEQEATINLLRTALREQREGQERRDTVHAAEMDNCVRQVKAECESVIKRHQKFIDQLIAEKASLSDRCESLVQETRELEEKHSKTMSTVEQKHKVELQRMKDITAATEKLKRERWVENKTQKIKELTVRGLEPELTRLTSQHEQEMSALRTLHAQELEQLELRAARRTSQQIELVRDQLLQEKEEALAKEREVLRQKMEKQQSLYEEEGEEQRRRLVAEVRRERDHLATLEARLETQFEERKRNLERIAEQDRERVRREYSDKIEEVHRKQQAEIAQLRDALKLEKEAWMTAYQQQQQQSLTLATSEIREQLKRERDREIEVVIERLENEATLSREEKEKTTENRLRRVREQLTSELRDVESALNILKDKYAEVRAQLQEKDDKLLSCEANNRSLQTQLLETQKIADQLSTERADLKNSLRSELDEETNALRHQIADQHSRHQQELRVLAEQTEREKATHQHELQQLYSRVKLAIGKKEEVVKVAKAKQKAAEEQSAHLQALLENRRRDMLLL